MNDTNIETDTETTTEVGQGRPATRVNLFAERTLQTTPCDVHIWIHRLKTSDDPLVLMQLLHNPPNTSRIDWEERKVILCYLQAAYKFHEMSDETDLAPHETKSIMTSPRTTLARTAFEMLCKHWLEVGENERELRKREPWKTFLWDPEVMNALSDLLGGETLSEDYVQDGIHGTYCGARNDRYKKAVREFCLGLAESLIELEVPKYTDEEWQKTMLEDHKPRRRLAVKILWYFDELNRLIELREYVDADVLAYLEQIILSQDIVIPVSTRSSREIRRKPRKVEDVLRIDPTKWFWRQGNGVKLTQAAYLYLGLAGKLSGT